MGFVLVQKTQQYRRTAATCCGKTASCVNDSELVNREEDFYLRCCHQSGCFSVSLQIQKLSTVLTHPSVTRTISTMLSTVFTGHVLLNVTETALAFVQNTS